MSDATFRPFYPQVGKPATLRIKTGCVKPSYESGSANKPRVVEYLYPVTVIAIDGGMATVRYLTDFAGRTARCYMHQLTDSRDAEFSEDELTFTHADPAQLDLYA
jgi:hypothetical protein